MKPQPRRPRNNEIILRPVHPNVGFEAAYRRRLRKLIDDMHSSFTYWISAAYKANEPEMAQDADRISGSNVPKNYTGAAYSHGGAATTGVWVWHAYVNGELLRTSAGVGRRFKTPESAEAAIASSMQTPAAQLQAAVDEMTKQWQTRFDNAADQLAKYFATSVQNRSDTVLQNILRKGGFSVKFKMTPAMRDVMKATLEEQVGLIKSIPQQYLLGVQGAVMRSVQAGRDLGTLTKELEQQYGVTRRRAALIARDQNNKSTAAMTRVRQVELGIDEAVWIHSHGGRHPRPTHLSNDGKRYKVSEGWFDPDPKVRKRIWPGELINCRCVAGAVIKGFS